MRPNSQGFPFVTIKHTKAARWALAVVLWVAQLCAQASAPSGGDTPSAALERFPDPEWQVAPSAAAVGTSDEKLTAYRSWLQAHAGISWASVIIKDGYLVFSDSGLRSNVRQINDCGSLLKPLQATVLGAALLQGKLKDIDENAFNYWKDPFLTPYANDRVITFRQFAQYHDRWNQPEPPGTLDYNNSSATAAGYCIAGLFDDVRGSKPSHKIAPIARREVMEKIHAKWNLWHWTEDFPPASWQDGPRLVLDSSVYELAKLGYLWLRKGRWQNMRIFSESFYRDAVTDWSPDKGDGRFCNYGYWWFINTNRSHLPAVPADAFYAYGWGEPKRGTLLLVIPSLDVVAILSMERLSDDKKWDVIQNARGKTNDGPRPWSAEVVKLFTTSAN
jgi:CubicO group peptidase (beta-lactamase class C family)